MPDLFGLNLGSIIADAFDRAGGLRPATLIKVMPGTRTVGDLAAGTNATTASYATQGVVKTITEDDTGTMTRRTRTVITLLGDALTRAGVEPEVNDRCTVDGVTYDIVGPVENDPAKARYRFTAAGA